eukprot:s10043_g1.t1
MAYYRAQEGTFRGEIPPEMDENLKKVLEEVREHPHQPAVQPAVSDDEAWGNWRASPDLRRPVTPPRRPVTPPKQPPRQKAKVEPSPVLQPPMPVPAEAPSLPAPVEAPPLGVPLPIQPPLLPPSTAAPTYSWTPTLAPRVGAVYSTPSGQSYRVREELGLLSEAEKEAWQIALNQARHVRPRVASRSLPMPPPAPQRYTVPPPPAPTGSTNLPPPASSSSTTTPWSHLPGFGNLLPPPQVEVDVPQIDAEANDHLSDYEPLLPSEDEGEDDLMGVAEAPKDDRPAIRFLEELWACDCVRYVPTPLTACDVYDLQAFCSLLVDSRSSCDKLPYSCIASLGNVEHEHVEHDVGRLSLGVLVGRSSVSVPVGRSSVDTSVGRSDSFVLGPRLTITKRRILDAA